MMTDAKHNLKGGNGITASPARFATPQKSMSKTTSAVSASKTRHVYAHNEREEYNE